jgi:hypothetical protein
MEDYLHFASAVPSVTVERRLDLFRLCTTRDMATPRPGWSSIFTKAWALVCKNVPALRRCYLSAPWPRLYQSPVSTALIAVERPYGDESAIFFLPLSHPDERPLAEIDHRIKWFKDRPFESSGAMRKQLRISGWFRPLRRLAWWAALNFFGRHRARIFGTFGVSDCSAHGVEIVQARTLHTSTLHPGIVGPGGQTTMRVSFDPRAVDAPTVARALDGLERILCNDIVAELRYLEAVRAA